MTEYECRKKSCLYETLKHIKNVTQILLQMQNEISKRIINHDVSKLEPPELESFVEYTPKLAKSTYGSDEYKDFLKGLKPALDHHYSKNRHHPEHFQNGINDMTLIDLIEMIADWKAASMRHNDGDIEKSIEINKKRFRYDDQLEQIFKNTAKFLDETPKCS